MVMMVSFFLGEKVWGQSSSCTPGTITDEGAYWLCDATSEKIRCDKAASEKREIAVNGGRFICKLNGHQYTWEKNPSDSPSVSNYDEGNPGNHLEEGPMGNHSSSMESLDNNLSNTIYTNNEDQSHDNHQMYLHQESHASHALPSFIDLLKNAHPQDAQIQEQLTTALLPMTFKNLRFDQSITNSGEKLSLEEIKEKLKNMRHVFDCAFTLDNPGAQNSGDGYVKPVKTLATSASDRYHSLVQGQVNKKTRRTVIGKWKKCPGQETISFKQESGGDDWSPFEASTRMKEFVLSLRFNIDKDAKGKLSGKNIVNAMTPGFKKETRYGWYSLEPTEGVGQGAVAWNLDCNSAIGTTNTCSNQDNFFRKLSSCNMRQLYHSFCLYGAIKSNWVRELAERGTKETQSIFKLIKSASGKIKQAITGSQQEKSQEDIISENIVYTFVLYELLRRYDPLTTRNNQMRAMENLFKISKEYQELQKMFEQLEFNKEGQFKLTFTNPKNTAPEYILKKEAIMQGIQNVLDMHPARGLDTVN